MTARSCEWRHNEPPRLKAESLTWHRAAVSRFALKVYQTTKTNMSSDGVRPST